MSNRLLHRYLLKTLNRFLYGSAKLSKAFTQPMRYFVVLQQLEVLSFPRDLKVNEKSPSLPFACSAARGLRSNANAFITKTDLLVLLLAGCLVSADASCTYVESLFF